MYLVIFALFGGLAYFLSDTFISLFSFMNTSNKYAVGNKWFFSLLIVNIIIFIFIVMFYYVKKDTPGYSGASGYNGLPGDNGDVCKICVK
jgi:hypothetical protein